MQKEVVDISLYKPLDLLIVAIVDCLINSLLQLPIVILSGFDQLLVLIVGLVEHSYSIIDIILNFLSKG